jgi:hypothetical protein
MPVLQSPMLARALYAHAELDQPIPAQLYTAVAQVLAYVYRLKAAMRGEGRMPDELPDPYVPPELDPHQPAPARPAQRWICMNTSVNSMLQWAGQNMARPCKACRPPCWWWPFWR